jgi:ribonuclease HII
MASSALLEFDRARGTRIAGADEVGRGCLAGPIVAAGVAFDYDTLSDEDLSTLSALNDSKKLSAETRELLFGEITRIASAVALISRSATYIDQMGLHRTNLHCLGTALTRVNEPGTVLLSDGYMPFGLTEPCEVVVKGDATSAAIAAASIIAKVTRDRMMRRMDALYPAYGFRSHVGYITPRHSAAVREIGPSDIHRRSFQALCYT